MQWDCSLFSSPSPSACSTGAGVLTAWVRAIANHSCYHSSSLSVSVSSLLLCLPDPLQYCKVGALPALNNAQAMLCVAYLQSADLCSVCVGLKATTYPQILLWVNAYIRGYAILLKQISHCQSILLTTLEISEVVIHSNPQLMCLSVC